MQLDLQDHSVWDNTEQITIESARNTGNLQASVGNVRRHAVTLREAAASGGAYQAGDVLFFVPRIVLPADWGPLKPRDAVIDAQTVRYTALSAEGRKWDRTGLPADYKLVSRNLTIAYDLRDLITVQAPTRTLDRTKAKLVAEWTAKYANLPARVQLVEQEAGEILGRRDLLSKYEIFIDREITITTEDRVIWVRGRVQSPGNKITDPTGKQPPPFGNVVILTVTGYENSQRIDELPKIKAGNVVGASDSGAA